MIRINEYFQKLQASYLFSDIAKRVAAYERANPERDIIKLGIGDVTRALPDACIQAFHKAVDEMAADGSFRGYGPEQGYDFLRKAIAENDFQSRGAQIDGEEVFVSAEEEPTRFLLMSGKPIGEPVAWYGPIVMNTQEELRVAFEEYREGNFVKYKA